MYLASNYSAILSLICLVSYSAILAATPLRHLIPRSTNLSSFTTNVPLDLSLDVRACDSLSSISRQGAIHHHHHIRTSHPTKRSLSYAINKCPIGRTFASSFCAPYEGPRAYQLYCRLQGPFSRPIEAHPGSCAPNEYCVSATNEVRLLPSLPPMYEQEAFCLSQEDMVKFSSDQLRKLGPGRGGTFALTPPVDMRGFATLLGEMVHEVFGVVVEDEASGAPMEGVVKIQATARGSAKQALLGGGVVECTSCSNLTMYPVPAGAQTVDLNVVMADSTRRAVIWVGSVALVSKLAGKAG